MCLSCICLLAMHTLICATFSLPPGVRGWLRLLLVALPGLFCLPFCLHVVHLFMNCPVKIIDTDGLLSVSSRVYDKREKLEYAIE